MMHRVVFQSEPNRVHEDSELISHLASNDLSVLSPPVVWRFSQITFIKQKLRAGFMVTEITSIKVG